MNKNINLKEIKANTNVVAYISPDIQVYEIGIENSILALSGGLPPEFGFDPDGGWF